MGSSRASTPAGRRRNARRGASAAHGRRSAAPTKRAPAKPPAKRTAPKSRKAPRKPKARAPKRTAKPRRTTKRRSATKRSRALRIVAVAGVVAGLLAVGYEFWFRSSSFVAVERVTVAGMTGPERGAADAALTKAAKDMTTLDLDMGALRAAVAGLATVVDIEVDADFPHGLAITVHERPPVLIAAAGGRALPVAGDGTVLAGVDASGEDLPEIAVAELPAEGKLTGEALEIALVIGAAPKPLLELVEDVTVGVTEGVTVTLRGDVPVYFGGGEDATDKWAAAAAVLADPSVDTLTYLDVRVADRPALGGAAPAVTESTTETAAPETALAP
jgi:cell division protein FtsQ